LILVRHHFNITRFAEAAATQSLHHFALQGEWAKVLVDGTLGRFHIGSLLADSQNMQNIARYLTMYTVSH
jgi:hypothetical protein